MKIAILGAGSVGGTLGRCWAGRGHEVVFGVRDPKADKVTALLKAGGGVMTADTVAGAAKAGEVVVLATSPWSGTEAVVKATAADLAGKVLIDCTNPMKPDMSGLAVDGTTSGGEQVAGWAPGARVIKAFNTIGIAGMANPVFLGQAASLLIAGDDADAKAVTSRLAEELGFEVVDAGPLRLARSLEQLALLWVTLAFPQQLGVEIAFKLLRR